MFRAQVETLFDIIVRICHPGINSRHLIHIYFVFHTAIIAHLDILSIGDIISVMDVPNIFHPVNITVTVPEPKKPRIYPKTAKIMTAICDCGCGKEVRQKESVFKRSKLHFFNRDCRMKWLSDYNKAKAKQFKDNPPESPPATSDVGAKPTPMPPSLENSVALTVVKE